MPLDGHAYLVSQGWQGKGKGLRQGAIARPVTVAQKKTLAGVGKDRDDAFPFWDHVFAAAAVNIQVKLHKDDGDSDSEGTPAPAVPLQRTSTGIISNRRPKTGTPALFGPVTPDLQASGTGAPRLDYMAAAKQEAARRTLYSMFFRGPTITSDQDKSTPDAQTDAGAEAATRSSDMAADADTAAMRREKGKKKVVAIYPGADSDKKRKTHKLTEDESKREKKRRKREEQATSGRSGSEAAPRSENEEGDFEPRRKAEKMERRRRKEEKRKEKEERRRLKEKTRNVSNDGYAQKKEGPEDVEGSDAPTASDPAVNAEKVHSKRKKREVNTSTSGEVPIKAKKKRKRVS